MNGPLGKKAAREGGAVFLPACPPVVFMLVIVLIFTTVVPVWGGGAGKWGGMAALSAVTVFDSGSGTAEDPYIITSAEQLDAVRNYVNQSGVHFKLGADLDLGISPYADGAGWIPIGSSTEPFLGTFDGNGHTIRNLTIHNSTDSSILRVGFFGELGADAVVTNLRLDDVYIDDDRGASISGSVTGVNHGLLTEISVTGAVYSYVGTAGVAGLNKDTGVIENVRFSGTVDVSIFKAGGISYQNDGVIDSALVISPWIGGSNFAGGITGTLTNGASLSNSVVIADHIVVSSATGKVGRIAGYDFSASGLSGNVADPAVVLEVVDGNPPTVSPDASDIHGADWVAGDADQLYYESKGWDFESVWVMGADGLPELRHPSDPVGEPGDAPSDPQAPQLPEGLTDTLPGDRVLFAGHEWIVVDPESGKLLKREPLTDDGQTVFQMDWYEGEQSWPEQEDGTLPDHYRFEPTDPDSIAYFLNTVWYHDLGIDKYWIAESEFDASLLEAPTVSMDTYGVKEDHRIQAKVGLLSFEEYSRLSSTGGDGTLPSDWTDEWFLLNPVYIEGLQTVYSTIVNTHGTAMVFSAQLAVHPVVHLQEGVLISDGSGVEGDPYQLDLALPALSDNIELDEQTPLIVDGGLVVPGSGTGGIYGFIEPGTSFVQLTITTAEAEARVKADLHVSDQETIALPVVQQGRTHTLKFVPEAGSVEGETFHLTLTVMAGDTETTTGYPLVLGVADREKMLFTAMVMTLDLTPDASGLYRVRLADVVRFMGIGTVSDELTHDDLAMLLGLITPVYGDGGQPVPFAF